MHTTQARHSLRVQLGLLTALRIIRMFLITMPVIVIYWQSYDLRMQDIFILQVIFSVAIVILEVPSGYLADRYGNKTALVWGAITGVAGFVCYWLLPGYTGFIYAELLLALSGSLVSGARDALLYETLEAHDATHLYTKHQGRMFGLGGLSEAVAAILGGIIASQYSINVVLAMQCVVLSSAIPITLLLDRYHTKVRSVEKLRDILHECFSGNKQLKWLNVMSGSVSAATLTVVWFIQPHWQSLGIPILYFGVLWAALNCTVAAGSFIAHRIERQVPSITLFAVIVGAPFILYTSMSVLSTSIAAVMLVFSFSLLRGISVPIVSDYVQQQCKTGNRATVLSANALVGRMIFSIFSPFIGWVTDTWSFGMAFLCAGCIFGLVSVIGFAGWYRARMMHVSAV